jgi:hypothetical protein
MVSEEKKSQYWDHFTSEAHRVYRPKKITDIRLKFVKKTVMDDDLLWNEIISRRQMLDKTPNELRETSLPEYERARANFWAMIREKIKSQLNQAEN